MAGIYMCSDSREVPFLASQFESTDARRAIPCFDEPAMKAPWTIQVTVPRRYSAVLTNMPEVSRNPEPLLGEGECDFPHYAGFREIMTQLPDADGGLDRVVF